MSETPRRGILDLARNAANARMTKDNLRHVLQNVIDYAAALEAERHTTNEALDDAVQTLRANRHRITELEVAAVEGRAALAALCHDLEDPGSTAYGALFLLQQATPSTPMEPGETVPKVYRASHDSIVMGLYTTRDAARAHCETVLRREIGDSGDLGWIPDDGSDGSPEELSIFGPSVDEDGVPYDTATGYVVTPLEVVPAYDGEADE